GSSASSLSPGSRRRHGFGLLERGAVPQNRVSEGLGDLLTVGVLFQEAGLGAIRQEGHFCKHARHLRAYEYDEGGLLDAQILEVVVSLLEATDQRRLHGCRQFA